METLYEFLADDENTAAVASMFHRAVQFGAGPSSDVGAFAQALTQGAAPATMHTLLRAAHAEFVAGLVPALDQLTAEDAPDLEATGLDEEGHATFTENETGRVWTDIRSEAERDTE